MLYASWSLPAIEFVVPSIGLLILHALGPKCRWSGYDIHKPVLTLLGHRQTLPSLFLPIKVSLCSLAALPGQHLPLSTVLLTKPLLSCVDLRFSALAQTSAATKHHILMNLLPFVTKSEPHHDGFHHLLLMSLCPDFTSCLGHSEPCVQHFKTWPPELTGTEQRSHSQILQEVLRALLFCQQTPK